ncbi:MAG: DUF1761 domain-containing protein [Nanoarchaeota archaeon]
MVNLLAVLVSGVIAMFIGFLWYGPLFGKMWIKLSNINPKQMKEMKKKSMGKSYFLAFIGTLLMSYILSLLASYFSATTFGQGAWLGFLIWAGFFVTSKLGMTIWEGKPLGLYVLNVFHDLFVLVIIGGVLSIWA